jgi:hypothetical protein
MGLKLHRGFESLSLRQIAPVAQLDRVPGYEPGGREFESLRARHNSDYKSMPYMAKPFVISRRNFRLCGFCVRNAPFPHDCPLD